MSDDQTARHTANIISLVQARRLLKDREKYLMEDCWKEVKEQIDILKKELKRTHNLIDANDVQLEELIDLLNEEFDVEEDTMYV